MILILKRLGYECDVASDGEAALRLIVHQSHTREHGRNEWHRKRESIVRSRSEAVCDRLRDQCKQRIEAETCMTSFLQKHIILEKVARLGPPWTVESFDKRDRGGAFLIVHAILILPPQTEP